MPFHNIKQAIIALLIGFTLILITLFVITVVKEYSWEKDRSRMNQESADALKNIEQNIAASNRQEHEIRQAVRKRERKTRQHNMMLSKAFQEGRCQDFLELLNFKAPLTLPEKLLQADLYMRGKCYDQNFAKAFEIYDISLNNFYSDQLDATAQPEIFFEEYYGHIAHLKFRLAALYWRGQGTTQDQEKAIELSKEAVIILAPWYARVSHRSSETELGSPNIWNMSDIKILENITFHSTGPWDMPEPLLQKIAWLKEIHEQGGKAYLNISLHLLEGTGRYKPDKILAYEWIYIASHFYDYGPAHYPRAMLIQDKDFYEEKKKFPIFSLDFGALWKENTVMRRGRKLLLRAVKAGDIRADKELLKFYKLAPAYFGQQENIYFWMLRLYQHNDPDITAEAINDFQKKLDKYQIIATEENVKKNRFPIPSLHP